MLIFNYIPVPLLLQSLSARLEKKWMGLKMMRKACIIRSKKNENLAQQFKRGIYNEGHQENNRDQNDQRPNMNSLSPDGVWGFQHLAF